MVALSLEVGVYKMKKIIIFVILCIIVIFLWMKAININHRTVVLNENFGVFISDGLDRDYPIESIDSTLDQSKVQQPLHHNGAEQCVDTNEQLNNQSLKVNEFTVEHPQLLLQRNVNLPLLIKIALGSGKQCSFWEYEWVDEPYVMFDLTYFFDEPEIKVRAVNIVLIEVNDQGIVESYESIEFLLKKK